MSIKDLSWNPQKMDIGDGSAELALAAQFKKDPANGLMDVLDRYQKNDLSNAQRESEANTGAYIDAIRSGKTPTKDGFYNSNTVSNAKYGYEKDQIALAFRQRAEGRAIAAAGRAAAAHKLKMKGDKAALTAGNAVVPDLYGSGVTTTPTAATGSTPTPVGSGLAGSVFAPEAETPNTYLGNVQADTAKMLMGQIPESANSEPTSNIPFVEATPYNPNQGQRATLSSTDQWKLDNPNPKSRGSYDYPAVDNSLTADDYLAPEKGSSLGQIIRNRSEGPQVTGEDAAIAEEARLREAKAIEARDALFQAENAVAGGSGDYPSAPRSEPTQEQLTQNIENALKEDFYSPVDPHPALNEAELADRAARNEAEMGRELFQKQIGMNGNNKAYPGVTELPVVQDPNNLTPEEIAAGNAMEAEQKAALAKEVQNERIAEAVKTGQANVAKNDFEKAVAKNAAKVKANDEKVTADKAAAILKKGTEPEVKEASKKIETSTDESLGPRVEKAAKLANKTALERVAENQKKKEKGTITTEQQEVDNAEAKMIASMQKVENNYIADKKAAQSKYVAYTQQVDAMAIKNSEKKWRKAQAKEQRDQYLGTLKDKYEQDTKLNIIEDRALKARKKVADDKADLAKTIATETRALRTSRQKLVDKGEGKWGSDGEFIPTPKAKDGSKYNAMGKLSATEVSKAVKGLFSAGNDDYEGFDPEDMAKLDSAMMSIRNKYKGVNNKHFVDFLQSSEANEEGLFDREDSFPLENDRPGIDGSIADIEATFKIWAKRNKIKSK